MSYKGKFSPKNRSKYRGDVSKITYRSSWERTAFGWCDRNPNVEWWGSEITVLPYYSEADQKQRRYFMDLTVKFINDDRIHLFEIKPLKETMPPKPPKRMTAKGKENYLKQLYSWKVNTDKWKATIGICAKKNWSFKILTEKSLTKYFGLRL